VTRLFWEVDPSTVDLREHRDYVIERVMSRGGWDAMRWLRAAYSREDLAEFLSRKGRRLASRELSYWTLIVSGEAAAADLVQLGGGRPAWAGP
jgi:hypothetical protein